MHRSVQQLFKVLGAAGVVILSVLTACRSQTGTPATGMPVASPGLSSPTVAAPVDATPGTGTVSPANSPTAVASAPDPGVPAKALPLPEGQPAEQSQWVKDRVAALKAIYAFTSEGEEWLDAYDLRQMFEQPAWFGSYGYGSWAGAGQAVPRSVLHELSHSYWGAFTVAGLSGLSWDPDDGSGGISPALARFHADLDLFLRQPPDRFEPLRDRFRNLPNLTKGTYPDLHHFGEAELMFMTGGNLQLLPPLLRKYFSGYIAEGGAGPDGGGGALLSSWDQAVSWFAGLEPEDKRVAFELFGIQHFPLDEYEGLPATSLYGLADLQHEAYEQEERQRLVDFAAQFDGILEREFALVDAAGSDRGFDFWRSYLSDKLDLHRSHPEVLPGIGTVRALQLASSLTFYAAIADNSPEEQADAFRENTDTPLVTEMAVLLKPRAIITLFTQTEDPDGVLATLEGRADRLAALAQAADSVADAAGQSTEFGAQELEQFLASMPDDQLRSDIFLLFDLLRSTEAGLTARVLPAMSDATLVRLLTVSPAAARSSDIGAERLLRAVGIAGSATLAQIQAGASLLAANSSGNFDIDEAYDEAVFSALDLHVDDSPAGVMAVLGASGMRLLPWLLRESDGALRALRADTAAALSLITSAEGLHETPQRLLHLLARKDPALAAGLTAAAAAQDSGLPVRVLRSFAYDQYWAERNAGPYVSLGLVAEYLVALIEATSVDWVAEQLQAAIREARAEIAAGNLEPGAEGEFLRTLQAAMEAGAGSVASLMAQLVEAASEA